jgi:gamma-butyrobetaine dioxygenase
LDDFYEAFQAFEKILNDPDMIFNIRLQPGDCVIFHNRRTLHGRTAFDPSSGERFFKGCYIDLDDFKSRLRTLRSSFSKKK